MGEAVASAVRDDYTTAPISEGLRATLGYLKKVTLAPDEIGPPDAEAVRRAGVSDAALVDALGVCALFNVIDRIADALGFIVPDAQGFAIHPKILLGFMGYRM